MINLLKYILYYPFLNILIFFIWLIPGHNAAWGIILLTIFVRLLLLIPSQKATQAQRKMMQLQPLLEELKQEFAEDKQGLAAAQMELYKKNSINPFASCGLSLIQLPILYILYFAISHGLDPHNPHLYSWVPRPDVINTVFLGINLLKADSTRLLPIIAAALQFVQVRMMLPPAVKKEDGSMDPAVMAQRQMLFIMPIITLFIATSLPAGTALYWVVTTLFTIGQQYVVNKEKLQLRGVKEAKQEGQEALQHHTQSPKLPSPKKETGTAAVKKGKGGVTVRVKKKE